MSLRGVMEHISLLTKKVRVRLLAGALRDKNLAKVNFPMAVGTNQHTLLNLFLNLLQTERLERQVDRVW